MLIRFKNIGERPKELKVDRLLKLEKTYVVEFKGVKQPSTLI